MSKWEPVGALFLILAAVALTVALCQVQGGNDAIDSSGSSPHSTARTAGETETPQPTLYATPSSPSNHPHDASEGFIRGYLDHGGRSEWEAYFVETVIPCEGEEFEWDWHWGDSNYLSVLQFDVGTWATAAHHTGHTNPEDLYHVGANTAYWSSVVPPSSFGGWADCW